MKFPECLYALYIRVGMITQSICTLISWAGNGVCVRAFVFVLLARSRGQSGLINVAASLMCHMRVTLALLFFLWYYLVVEYLPFSATVASESRTRTRASTRNTLSHLQHRLLHTCTVTVTCDHVHAPASTSITQCVSRLLHMLPCVLCACAFCAP